MATYSEEHVSEGSGEGQQFLSFALSENHIYGASRLGVDNRNLVLTTATVFFAAEADYCTEIPVSYDDVVHNTYDQSFREVGLKFYELANHLGNVLEVITDRKVGYDDGTYDMPFGVWQSSTLDEEYDFYTADIVSYSDYYPYGMLLNGRHNSEADGYRYGFNGMEADDEVKNLKGTSYDFGARMYDPRVGRWLTIDPLAGKYPSMSPYIFVGNMPIIAIDPNGKEIIFTVTKKEDGTLHVHMTLNAKLVDETYRGISEDKMGEYKDRISSAIKEYYELSQGHLWKVEDVNGELVSGDFDMSVTVNLEVSEGLEPGDHGIYLRDPGNLPDESSESCVAPVNVDGLSEPGTNYIYLSTSILENKPEPPSAEQGYSPDEAVGGENRPSYAGTGFTETGEPTLERTVSHELGHNALGDKNEELGHANVWVNNLLTSSSQKHNAGVRVNARQIEAMIKEFQKGNLNNGPQEGPKK